MHFLIALSTVWAKFYAKYAGVMAINSVTIQTTCQSSKFDGPSKKMIFCQVFSNKTVGIYVGM